MTEPLYMVQLRLDRQRVARFAHDRRLFDVPPRPGQPREREPDLGYVVHSLLAELFGPLSPKPFALDPNGPGSGGGRTHDLLGYSAVPKTELAARAAFAEPVWHEAVRWDLLADKPMPLAFPAGQRLGFAVRACPTMRSRRLRADRSRSPEVNAVIGVGARDGIAEGLDKGEVYCRWLADEFARHGGARPLTVRPTAMRLRALTRRGRERRPVQLPLLPDVSFSGLLEVTDPAAFPALLRRGIGRHRAFGFGMLLLRPAGARTP
jgi:CRISPR system Cascade subunit CasE